MGSQLRIIWRKRALRDLNDVAAWYNANMGCSSASKVVRSAEETVRLLSLQPGIGIFHPELSNNSLRYYSFPIHPFYRIVYRYTADTLYVCALRANRMK